VSTAGWTKEQYNREKQADERSFEEQCKEVIDVLLAHENSWPFRKPVDLEKVKDYLEIVSIPMDLETINIKVERGLRAPGAP
jgi:histone acetyltransferase